MSVFAEFFEHSNFKGDAYSALLSNSWRYRWIKLGSPLRNEISSFRAQASGGFDGNVYGFTSRDFLGSYGALNMGEGWTSWYSNVGSELNDDIESAILVNRNRREVVVELNDQVADPFKERFDDAVKGTRVSRRGEPRIYAVFWPSHDPSRKFVRIEQDLRVAIDWWPDYDARVRYDCYLYLDGNRVAGYVAWTETWVEGGVFSDSIIDDLHPKLVDGAATLTGGLQGQLEALNTVASFFGLRFGSLYLLPGREPPLPPPVANVAHTGAATENCCLVLTRID